ncbi:DNA-directed RNA polymerase subunit beta [Ureibacillus sp. FSL K6-8385]|nr:DNA-directed RNA polymerase subunit beta [Ureibacillus terrenus]MED3661400.1 DNA-directed RNA polymerase subunit beta [Ureibacillus terrenus]MED3764127.1 DNA-directed RNA polymerase subunit beta [Ureibacillus terrenus]
MANELKSGMTQLEKQEKDKPIMKWMKKNDNGQKEPNGQEPSETKANLIQTLKTYSRYSTRTIPIWKRIVIVLALMIFASIFGLMIGYGVIGDGKAFDALKWSTYKHIFDLMNGTTK